MDFVRQLILYVVLIAAFWGTVVLVKSISRVQVPSSYSDINQLEEYTSYRVDRNITINQLRPGDAICFRLGKHQEREVNFGWVAALPGDEVSIVKGEVLVNGKNFGRGDRVPLPDCGPLPVPANHVYVVSDRHENDSVGHGPIPAIAIHGRMGTFP